MSLSDLLGYFVNAVIRQVDPADIGSVVKCLLCDFCDEVVLQVQVVCPGWDLRDHTDVPVLTVEGIWIAGRAQTLPRTVGVHRRGSQDDWREVRGLHRLWLFRCSRFDDSGPPGGGRASCRFLWPWPLGGHHIQQEEQSECRDDSHAGLHGSKEANIWWTSKK